MEYSIPFYYSYKPLFHMFGFCFLNRRRSVRFQYCLGTTTHCRLYFLGKLVDHTNIYYAVVYSVTFVRFKR